MIGNNENNIPGQEESLVSGNIENSDSDNNWLRISRDVHEASTNYYENSIQLNWQRNIENWNSRHPRGSKFYSESYKQRSKLFRPVSRTAERNSSAAVAAALFSNMDVLDAQPVDPTDVEGAASASVMKELLQYRLAHDVKWFMTAMGAWQDTQVYGPCVSYIAWEYEERDANPPADPWALTGGEEVKPDQLEGMAAIFAMQDIDFDLSEAEGPTVIEGEPSQENINQLQSGEKIVVKDGLVIDLLAPEYFRFDPSADWRDPVGTSPYVIRIVPMYVDDVRNKMLSGEWNEASVEEIVSYGSNEGQDTETLRRAREGEDRVDANSEARPNDKEFDVVYPREYFIKLKGMDYVYWTLGDRFLLTEPVPIEEVYFHGRRPFVYGQSVIEAHKTTPDSVIGLIAPLQENINDITNQRQDNVKLALNKRYIVKRGSNVDLAALARNVPGGSVTSDNPQQDVQMLITPDVTSSSYAEVERMSVEANEMTGTFSGSSVQNNRSLNETVGGMQLLSEGANQLQSFDIRTWVETWVQPTLNLAMLTIQHYETDDRVLAIAGEKGLATFQDAKIEGIPKETLFTTPLEISVNVGLGATSPFQKINNLAQGLQILMPYVDPAQLNRDEIGKEVMGALGYGDGARFIKSMAILQQEQQDNPTPPPPEVQAEQMKAQLQMQLKQMELEAEMRREQMRLQFEGQQAQLDRDARMTEVTMTLSSKENQKVADIQNKTEIEGMKNKTNRDKVAVQESSKANELNYKRTTGNTGI